MRSEGFSLIELLVVLFIIGLATATVAPRLQAGLDMTRLKSATRETAALCRTARADAIAGAGETVILIDLEHRQVRLEADGSTEGSARGSASVRVPQSLKVTATAADSEQVDEDVFGIRFFPDGSSTGGRIEIETASERSFAVDVDWLTGLTRILD